MKLDIYVSNCLGKNGIEIQVPKIRTMRHGADEELSNLVEKGRMNANYKIENDHRIIPSKRFLRNFFLDEIPQFFYNVIYKRDMKLVGERPKTRDYWKSYPSRYKDRSLKSKPGFLGIHKYDNSNKGLKSGRRYQAEKKLRPVWTDIKYGSKIIFNILTDRAKGD